MRMRVVNDRRAMRRPARVGNARAVLEAFGGDAGRQLGDPRRAAGASQSAPLMDRDAARVVAAVFEPTQALDEDRDDVARTDGRDDSAHGWFLKFIVTVRAERSKLLAKSIRFRLDISFVSLRGLFMQNGVSLEIFSPI
jgi:hypothetical protein